MKGQVLHYKQQRDALIEFLIEIGIPKAAIAKKLGITTAAVSLQFPRKRNGKE